MLETLKLKNPINGPDGGKISELKYDVEEIDGALADAMLTGVNGEDTYKFLIRMGRAAILAVNPDLTRYDLDRIKGSDISKLIHIGSLFTNASEGASTSE